MLERICFHNPTHLSRAISTEEAPFDPERRKSYLRLGSMDLNIAAIAIANQATILTRNIKDSGQIANLAIEDWTV